LLECSQRPSSDKRPARRYRCTRLRVRTPGDAMPLGRRVPVHGPRFGSPSGLATMTWRKPATKAGLQRFAVILDHFALWRTEAYLGEVRGKIEAAVKPLFQRARLCGPRSLQPAIVTELPRKRSSPQFAFQHVTPKHSRTSPRGNTILGDAGLGALP